MTWLICFYYASFFITKEGFVTEEVAWFDSSWPEEAKEELKELAVEKIRDKNQHWLNSSNKILFILE